MKHITDLELFLSYLTGDFSNARQFAAEEGSREDIHPLAIHVNRPITSRVRNLPADFSGEFLLEESYYYYRDGTTKVKPHLFHFSENPDKQVVLRAYGLPEDMDPPGVRCENPALVFDYKSLKISSTFDITMKYTRNSNNTFSGSARVERGSVTFTLKETIGPDILEVMELLEKEGRRLTPYSTPIRYHRHFTPEEEAPA